MGALYSDIRAASSANRVKLKVLSVNDPTTLDHTHPIAIIKGIAGARRILMDANNCRALSLLLELGASDLTRDGHPRIAAKLREAAATWRTVAAERQS